MKKSKCILCVLPCLILLSGCSAKSSVSPFPSSQFTNTPIPFNSFPSITNNYESTPIPSAKPTNIKNLLITPVVTTRQPTVTVNPNWSQDNGKTSDFIQSKKYPLFAYDEEKIPKALYLYSFNQSIIKTKFILYVSPVNFYNETLRQDRISYLDFFNSFVHSYFTLDYKNSSKWEQSIKSFCNQRSSYVPVNGMKPSDFISSKLNKIVANKEVISVTDIITDDALIYLNRNAHYSVRGRVILNVNSSTDPSLSQGKQSIDIEIAFKENLIKGSGGWGQKKFAITEVHVLE
jgi:hypothetical protein